MVREITQTMKLLGYKKYNVDHIIFYQHLLLGEITIVIVYLDDIIVTGKSDIEVIKLETHLKLHFKVRNLGLF